MLNRIPKPRLRRAREELRLSLRNAAALAGDRVSHQTVANWELGVTEPRRGPAIGAFYAMCRAYQRLCLHREMIDQDWTYTPEDFEPERLMQPS